MDFDVDLVYVSL